MSLLFVDGFAGGDYATKWSQNGGTATPAFTLKTSSPRVSGCSYLTATAGTSGTNLLRKTLATAVSEAFCGIGVRVSNASSAGSISFVLRGDSNATTHLTLMLNASGFLELRRGTTAGTLLATGTTQLSANVWNYIEIRATIADSGGVCQVRLNGSTSNEIDFSGDTKNAGTNSSIDSLELARSGTGISCDWTDVYICDTSGSLNNTWLGDVRVANLVPVADGAASGLTGSDGNQVSNWQQVDELPFSSTDYNGATVGGTLADTYGLTDLPAATGSVKGVALNVSAAKTDAGAATINLRARSGGTNYDGAGITPTTTYATYQQIRETDPATSAAWTQSAVNALRSASRWPDDRRAGRSHPRRGADRPNPGRSRGGDPRRGPDRADTERSRCRRLRRGADPEDRDGAWLRGMGSARMMLTELPAILLGAGLDVTEVPGWQDRGHFTPAPGYMQGVKTLVCHHTAGKSPADTLGQDYPSLPVIRDGRPGLAGPLAQLGLGRSGRWYVIAAGVCWHAGEVLRADYGNTWAVGCEAENTGLPGDPWPEVQLDSYAAGMAALARHYGLPVDRVLGHKEVCSPVGRKSDPDFDMAAFRARVAAHMEGTGTMPLDDADRKWLSEQLVPAIATASRDSMLKVTYGTDPDKTPQLLSEVLIRTRNDARDAVAILRAAKVPTVAEIVDGIKAAGLPTGGGAADLAALARAVCDEADRRAAARLADPVT